MLICLYFPPVEGESGWFRDTNFRPDEAHPPGIVGMENWRVWSVPLSPRLFLGFCTIYFYVRQHYTTNMRCPNSSRICIWMTSRDSHRFPSWRCHFLQVVPRHEQEVEQFRGKKCRYVDKMFAFNFNRAHVIGLQSNWNILLGQGMPHLAECEELPPFC